MRRAALLAVLVLLAGCASSTEQAANPACARKWVTAMNLGRCLLGIKPEAPAKPSRKPDEAPPNVKAPLPNY